ncbi:MAG TPA: FkbM family methyltransferase [Blastococcus sp.]
MQSTRQLAGTIRRRARNVTVRTLRERASRARWQATDVLGRTVGIRLRSRGIKAIGHSASDAFVFHEIFGAEDAYRRDILVPLMRGGTVVEIGAHKGYFTALAASVAARVLVFEPDERNYRYLQETVALNKATNVTALSQAVAAEAGTKAFTVSAFTDARHTFFPSQFSGQGRTVQVECTTLPDVLREHAVEVVDVLKLDCEGSEYDVLLGCGADTMARIRCIALEMHESEGIGHTAAEMVGFLESHGFTGDVYDHQQRGDVQTCMGLFTRP